MLFDIDAPPGFQYRDDFITSAGEASLLDEIARLEFATFEMRGVVAKRRVAFFGKSYDREAGERATPPIPDWLFPLRTKLADWLKVEPSAFAMALINEYTSGAPVGWHRDAPQYGVVAGVSLLSPARLKFRPYVALGERAHLPGESKRRVTTHEITLDRRSAYLMTGDSRARYEHHVPPVTALRYSITFRTVRSGTSLAR